MRSLERSHRLTVVLVVLFGTGCADARGRGGSDAGSDAGSDGGAGGGGQGGGGPGGAGGGGGRGGAGGAGGSDGAGGAGGTAGSSGWTEDLPTGLGPLGRVYDIALDADSIYIAAGDRVAKIPKAGGEPVVLASELTQARAVAVDGERVYFADAGTASASDGSVRSVALAGGAAKTLASGQARPRALALGGGYVAWVNEGSSPGAPVAGGAVVRVARDGSDEPKKLVGALFGPMDVAIVGGDVYWTDGERALNRVPLAGGSHALPWEPADGGEFATLVATDGAEVFFYTGHRVRALAVGSDGVRTLVDVESAVAMTDGGAEVLLGFAGWASGEGDYRKLGWIEHAAHAGGSHTLLHETTDTAGPHVLAADAKHIYYAEGNGLHRLSR